MPTKKNTKNTATAPKAPEPPKSAPAANGDTTGMPAKGATVLYRAKGGDQLYPATVIHARGAVELVEMDGETNKQKKKITAPSLTLAVHGIDERSPTKLFLDVEEGTEEGQWQEAP